MEVAGVGAKARQSSGRKLVDARLDSGDTIFLERVREEPGINSRWFRFALLEQLLEHADHAFRTDPRMDYVVESLLVRLRFVLTAEAGEDRATRDVDRRVSDTAVADAGENAGQGDPDVRALFLFHLLHGVASHDVADFVAQNARDFIHLVRALDETAIDVDESARNRERVHFLAVDNEEMPVEILTFREPRYRVTQNVDVPIELRILDDR
jgi:hypothetical protein